MKPFMIIAKVDDATFTKFADTYTEAKDISMHVECGLGGYAEIYTRQYSESGSEYRLLES